MSAKRRPTHELPSFRSQLRLCVEPHRPLGLHVTTKTPTAGGVVFAADRGGQLYLGGQAWSLCPPMAESDASGGAGRGVTETRLPVFGKDVGGDFRSIPR